MFYLLLIILFNACNTILPECNSQDRNSSCYIIPPIIKSISSYDPRSIEIEFDTINFETENIIIIRESSTDTITIYNVESPITIAYPFYMDTEDILIGQSYHYIIKFIDNEQNQSVAVDTLITHELATPDNFLLAQRSAAIIGVSWSHTPKIKDSQNSILGFEIVKKMTLEGNFIEDTIMVNLPVTGDEPAFIISGYTFDGNPIYTYIDEEIIPFTTYEYKMKTRYTNNDYDCMIDCENYFYTETIAINLEFPQVEIINWHPKNLETISIKIEFEEPDGWEDVQMSLSRRRDELENQSDGYEPVFSDYLLRNLDTLDVLESPNFNERWEYILDWWSGSYHDTIYVPIITLPTSHLVYIEGTEGETFDLINSTGFCDNGVSLTCEECCGQGGGECVDEECIESTNIWDDNPSVNSIEPFYVFSTETPAADPSYFGGNDAQTTEYLNIDPPMPRTSISIVDIIGEINAFTQDWYINPGLNSYSSIFSYGTSENIPDSPNLDNPGLRLLMESEWEYLARNGVGDTSVDHPYADYSFGAFGESFLNSYNAGDPEHAPTDVASFIPSPFGIFDLNGNVWEWCHSIEENGKYVLRGGSYQDQGYECSNASRREISDLSLNDIKDSSIGYRLAISAIPFIDYLKDRRCEEKGDDYNGCY